MPRVRAPWWMYVVAASFLVFLGLTFYLAFLGTEPPGVQAAFAARGALVRAVLPGSAAEQAGLQPGDVVVAMDGQALRGLGDWIGIVANLEAGRVSQWQVERGGRRLPVALTPARISFSHWTSERQLSTLLAFGCRVVTLLLAFLIAFSRPYDLVARLGACLVAVMAIGAEAPTIGAAVAWRGLPLPLAALVFIPGTCLPLAGPILLTFFANFPRKLFRARWPWVLVWVPAALIGTFVCVYFYCMVYRPQRLTALPGWGPIVMVGNNVTCALAGLAALVLNYRRLEDVNERRRVRLIVAGAIVTWLPTLWLIVAFYFAPGARYSPILAATNFLTLVSPLSGLAFPLALAHAILRHRLFDIRVMIRQGLQYALARRAVMSAASAVAVVLLLDLLLHKDQPPASVLRARGWFYFVLGGLALFARMRRQVWLDALDRHFFRERCDAHRLLREVAEEIRRAGSLERVAPLVTARVEAALHPEFAAILVREPRERYFRTLSCAPAGQAPPPLSSDGKLVAFLGAVLKLRCQ